MCFEKLQCQVHLTCVTRGLLKVYFLNIKNDEDVKRNLTHGPVPSALSLLNIYHRRISYRVRQAKQELLRSSF